MIVGCAMPEGEQGLNMARVVALRAGLPDTVPGVTINRFCASGLQSIAMAADAVRSGSADVMLAGGAESMSMIPMTGVKFSPNPWMVDHQPELYLNMGLTAERVQQKYGDLARGPGSICAGQSPESAMRRKRRAASMPRLFLSRIETTTLKDGKETSRTDVFQKDEGPRADTSLRSSAETEAAFPCRKAPLRPATRRR